MAGQRGMWGLELDETAEMRLEGLAGAGSQRVFKAVLTLEDQNTQTNLPWAWLPVCNFKALDKYFKEYGNREYSMLQVKISF